MLREILIGGGLIIISAYLQAQFPSGVDHIHEAIANMSRGGTGDARSAWAREILGTEEAINVDNTNRPVRFTTPLSGASRQYYRTQLQLIANMQSAEDLSNYVRAMRTQARAERRSYLAARNLAFIVRNDPYFPGLAATLRDMREDNDLYLRCRQLESAARLRAERLGMRLCSDGQFRRLNLPASTPSSTPAPGRSTSPYNYHRASQRGQSNAGANASRNRNSLNRLRPSSSARNGALTLGSFLRRIARLRRGRPGKVYVAEHIRVEKNKASVHPIRRNHSFIMRPNGEVYDLLGRQTRIRSKINKAF